MCRFKYAHDPKVEKCIDAILHKKKTSHLTTLQFSIKRKKLREVKLSDNKLFPTRKVVVRPFYLHINLISTNTTFSVRLYYYIPFNLQFCVRYIFWNCNECLNEPLFYLLSYNSLPISKHMNSFCPDEWMNTIQLNTEQHNCSTDPATELKTLPQILRHK